MLLTVVLPTIFLLTVVPIVIRLHGITRWQAETAEIRHRLDATRSRIATRVFDLDELADLPEPVQRFFQAVLTPGAPLVAVAEFGHRGRINLEPERERWSVFASTQMTTSQRPGFDWDARIRRAPGVQLFVHDGYVAGEGRLKAVVLGLWRVAEEQGSPELAQAQLMRYLAEAVWYPTKLLPSQGVEWEAIDAERARASLSDGEHRVSLTFEFEESGLIRAVHAEGRWRLEPGGPIERPWEGRFSDYEWRSGMRVPTSAEVAWLLPSGRRPYWRGMLTDILYKFA
jgi:hypothetical protein